MLANVLWLCMGFTGLTAAAADLRAAQATDPTAQVAAVQPAESAAAEPEAPESAVSSPPLGMDDPGTPGPQGIEVNFVGSLEQVGQGRGTESLLDANYGIGERIQLKYERPYVTARDAGVQQQHGLGATVIGVKWRFVDRNGWQLAVYPAYTFNDAFTVKDEQGNPEEKEGHLAYFPLLVSKNVARVYTVAANLGYSHNTDHLTNDTVVALGVGRALGANGRVLAEVFSERDESFVNRQTDVRVGIVELILPGKFARSGYEFPAYASFSHNTGRTEAGETATTTLVGVSVVKLPKGE